ncbi:copper resistance protein CopC [Microbacterium sp.]|jgi:methionine-rich copper-binding protein CopC|uniref:copper resistance protein CopC n=1 Tax=Microbacterium sp. TaxID=51671 RepID=UPI0037CB2F9B
MKSQPRRRPPTVRRPGLAVLLVALCAFFIAAPSAAFAHDELIGSTPDDGEIIETGPSEIDLRFSANPLEGDGATEVLVIDPSGAEVQQGDPILDRNGVIQELSGADERGTYTVVWRIVSSDGHPISGELTFSVGETSVPADIPTTTDADAGDATGAGSDAGGFDLTPIWIVIGIVAVGLGGALVAILMARARGRNGGV